MNDLVSIITPSYNTALYVADTIRSVLAQTYTNWEMLIVDDGSTDNTEEIVKPFLDDERIKFYKNPNHDGAAEARNYALRMAKGKWIAFLDSDDVWYPQKLEKQVAFMEKNGYRFSYTNYAWMDINSNSLGKWVTGPKKVTKSKLYNFCWMGCLTVMYDAEYIGVINIPPIRKNNDYAMWLRVIKKADCYLLDEVLATYRRCRTGSISTSTYATLIKWHYRLYRMCDNRNPVTATFLTFRNLFFGVIKKLKYIKE